MEKGLFLWLGCFLVLFGFGQSKVGLKVGFNSADIKFLEPDNTDARAGFHAGALLRIPLKKSFFFQPEVLYSLKGYQVHQSAFNEKATGSLHYINLPLLIGYRPIEQLSILLGPELGYLTSGKAKIGDFTNDLSDTYRNFDLGLDLGAEYGLTKQLGVGIRYSHGIYGLVPVTYTNQFGNETGKDNIGKNRVFQLSFMYLLSK